MDAHVDTYIARQPILNKDDKVVAYELLYYQDSSSLYNQRDYKVANAIIEFFNQIDSSNFLDNKDAFLTFTPNLLMQNVPRVFDEKKLVIQIEDNVLVHPVARMIIQRYKRNGYRLALTDFQFNNRYFDMLPLVDIIKVDFSNLESDHVDTNVSIAHRFGKQVAAYNVNTPEARAKAEEYGCEFIQGESVAGMLTSKVHRMEHLQSNFFRLMVAITRDEPEVDEIARLISQDVTLTFSLLKMVNSAYFALTNKVKDVKQALTILGLGQLKQWIYLLSFSNEGGPSDEIIRTSFLRATFCQELSQFMPNFNCSRSEAYLLGMFSTLGVLLEVPIEDALKELPVSDEIKAGLTTGEGKCGDLLRLCLCYEKGDWRQVGKEAETLGIPVNIIAQKYFEAVEFVNEIWNDLMEPLDAADQPKPNHRLHSGKIEVAGEEDN